MSRNKVVYSTRWFDDEADKADINQSQVKRYAQDHSEAREPLALALNERKGLYTWLKTEAR